ncbi:MAG: ABC transporter permease [Candidatus Riflebacteria bacterium]|nr:ABC transporter permease [Candidatus Riflebacteria bacterium]
MSILSVIRLALISLARNKTRSFLTALGIIIGVSSVITMVGLGQGAYWSVQDQISKMGTSLLMVMPGSSSQGGFRGGAGSLTNLTEDDTESVIKDCPSVKFGGSLVRTGAQVVYASQNWSTSVQGVSENYLEIRAWNLEEGEFFSESDVRSGTKICVLGKTVADNLFGNVNPVGKTIRIKKIPFEVIGVLESKGQTGMGQDQDDMIVAPLATVQQRLMGITNINQILVSAISDEAVDDARKEITSTLRRKHKLAPKDDDDFNVRTQADLAQTAGATLGIIALLLGSVASVSLLVGGIGIMNIMLVSVTERTREIGIRMAIGARGRDILIQFLIEAMTLSGSGGLIGIGFGVGTTHLLTTFTEWPTMISFPAVAGSFLFSALVGIFFGLYPAWKASNLDPIEALRFE